MLAEQPGPDLDVAVLDLGELQIQRALLLVVFRTGEDAIQVGGVGFVLPVMLEGVEIRAS
jgi:hypothetical protein